MSLSVWSFVVAQQPLVDALGVVQQRDVQVGVERLDLVEVERGEQPMPPAERGVGVDEHVLVLLGERRISLKTARRRVFRRVMGRLRMRPGGTSGASAYIILPTWQTCRSIPLLLRNPRTASRNGPFSTPTCPVTIARMC